MDTSDTIRKTIDQLRGNSFFDERDVEARLVEPCFRGLGWNLSGAKNQRTQIPEGKRLIWKQGFTVRDYILRSNGREVLHVETKFRWPGWTMDFDRFLCDVNRGYWDDTDRDGPLKDLALVLWGADARSVRRAALMDERQLIVFDKRDGWKVTAEADVFGDFDPLWRTFKLLAPP